MIADTKVAWVTIIQISTLSFPFSSGQPMWDLFTIFHGFLPGRGQLHFFLSNENDTGGEKKEDEKIFVIIPPAGFRYLFELYWARSSLRASHSVPKGSYFRGTRYRDGGGGGKLEGMGPLIWLWLFKKGLELEGGLHWDECPRGLSWAIRVFKRRGKNGAGPPTSWNNFKTFSTWYAFWVSTSRCITEASKAVLIWKYFLFRQFYFAIYLFEFSWP